VVFIKFLPYGKQQIDENDIKSVLDVLKSDFITQGPKINKFEEKLAEYCGADYAVTFNSGTAALHGAYFALGLKKNDEIVTSPNSFVATANAALYLGAHPQFSDIELETGNLDVSKVEEKITDKTKAIVPVHYSGNPVPLEELSEIAQKHDIELIEDAAHAIGAKYQNKKIGSCEYSSMAIFSFHPVKHITTGEGGAVLTNDYEYYEKMQMFKSHGITKNNLVNESHGDWYYEMQYLGYNYRMTDIQAVLGISQLKKLDGFVKRRREIVAKYNATFKNNLFFDFTKEKENCFSSYHLYPILLKDKYIDKKREIFDKLRKEGMGVQTHYIPIYSQPYYQKHGYKNTKCLVSEEFYRKEISIPLYPDMTDDNVDKVIKTIFNVFECI
jgi:UDP-4-amino-4,6-dideoxy-N-acetyl-beta-L-altrosamine transaminase